MNQGLGFELVEGIRVFHDLLQAEPWRERNAERWPASVSPPPPVQDILSQYQKPHPPDGVLSGTIYGIGRIYAHDYRDIYETRAWLIYRQQMVFQTQFGKMIE